MKNNFTLLNNATAFSKKITIIFAIFFYAGTAISQQVDLALITGYQIHVNAGPTICEPSSATILNYLGWWNIPTFWTEDQLPANGASYHTAEAGKTSYVVVDIPAVGNLPGFNGQMLYYYGIPGIQEVIEEAQPVSNAPSGFIRFELPVTFDRGAQKAYLTFFVIDNVGGNTWSSRVTIPITVLGPTTHEVPILGTTVDPQIPYLVLHAPPGDGSSSEFQDGKTTCRQFENTYAEDGSNSANLAVKLGIAGSAGIFVTTDFEFSVTVSGGLTVGDMSITTTSDQTCVSVNEGFMTSALTGPDGGGDVFIGYGTDLAYGIYPLIALDQANCTTYLDTNLVYMPTGLPRKFIYTKEAILTDIDNQQTIVNDVAASVMARNTAQNQIDVWNQVLAMNDANVSNPDNPILGTTSFSGGTTSTNESSITITESNSIQYEHYLEGNVGVEAVIEIGGSGVTGGYEYKSSKRFGETQNQSDESSKLVKYTFSDDDSGDIFNVEIVKDPMFGTPIFRPQTGTRSSCPFQGGYQRDQPVLKHDDSTSDHILLEDNPILSSATFKVDLCNESDEERTYNLKLNAQSNLNGAVVSGSGVPLNGNDLGQPFTVPAQSCLEDLIVEVKMLSSTSPLEYTDLELFFYAPCEESIQSSVFASVYFEDPTGVEDVDNNISKLSVFPNPSSGVLNVAFDLKEATPVHFKVYDLLGRLQMNDSQKNFPSGNNQRQFDLHRLSSGIYLLEIQAGDARVMKKIRVE